MAAITSLEVIQQADITDDIVLQCSSCRAIIGDTRDYVCMVIVDEVAYIILSGATDVDIKTERHDQVGPHEHSSPAIYYCIECSICNASIGRMYTEPPDGLECARKQFTFDLGQTTRYKLGSSDVKVLSSDDEERTQELEEQAAPMEDTSERPDLQSQIHALTEEMVKLKRLLVRHDDQLRVLPGYKMK